MTDRSEPVFLGWPNEGIQYWNAHWRGPAVQGLLAEFEAAMWGDDDD